MGGFLLKAINVRIEHPFCAAKCNVLPKFTRDTGVRTTVSERERLWIRKVYNRHLNLIGFRKTYT